MNAEKKKELILNVRTLNSLHALYQGRFTQLNVLSQLGHPLFKLEDLKRTKECLEETSNYIESLKKGQTILKLSLGANQTSDGKHLYSLLTALKPELTDMAQKAKKILLDPYYYDNAENVSFLCSCAARQLYSQDNYARKYVEIAERIGDDPQTIDAFKRMSEQLTTYLAFIGTAIQTIKEEEKPTNFYEHLRFMTRLTPGLLRSQAHDIVQLVTALSGNFGFKESGFIELEAKSWDQAGYSPLEAGYWRAFDFGIKDAQLWESYDIKDPCLAAEWSTAGFGPEPAIQWMDVLFAPLLAIQWHNAGFDPRTAAVLVKKGYATPLELPEGATEDIVNEAYKDFYEEALREQEALEQEQEQAA